MSWLARRIDAARRDDGVAIILVVGVGMIVSMLLLTLTAYTILSVTHSRREQDTQAALSAAQAGVDDYLARLNADNTYWQNPNNCLLNVAMRTIGDVCNDNRTGWSPISGASTTDANPTLCTVTDAAGNFAPSCAVYHYDADSTQTISTGTIKLTSTGKAHGKTRSVRVVVRRESFADFMYYTDLETADPANLYVYSNENPALAAAQCSLHYWDTPARPPFGTAPNCIDIYFGGGDTINGPLHSNDALLIGDATFNGPVTTAYPSCQPDAAGVAPPTTSCYRDASGTAVFNKGIAYVTPLLMPPTNVNLHAQVDPALATTAPGCLYTGPTRIHFNAGGSMTVWSPYTKTLTNPACGTAPFTAAPQTITPPPNNVIYVDPVPGSQVLPATGPCAVGAIGGFPQAGDVNAMYGYSDYECRKGTVYVDGVFNGRMTIGADFNVIVVGDITYDTSSAGNDSLGLVANQSVLVYHPVACTSTSTSSTGVVTCNAGDNISRTQTPAIPFLTGTFNSPTINAAMLSLNHSVGVQAYKLGAGLGTLNVYGSIAQKYRGPVGQNSGANGYIKNYVYDNRLKFAPPPYYLSPVQSKYISAVFSETAPAYTPTQP